MQTLGLKNINLLTKEQFDGIETPATDELYAVSGSGFGMPSDNYIDLTLGESSSTYIAPANGYLYLMGVANNTQSYVGLIKKINGKGVFGNSCTAYSRKDNSLWCGMPVRKGDVINYGYQNINLESFTFVYAEGEI